MGGRTGPPAGLGHHEFRRHGMDTDNGARTGGHRSLYHALRPAHQRGGACGRAGQPAPAAQRFVGLRLWGHLPRPHTRALHRGRGRPDHPNARRVPARPRRSGVHHPRDPDHQPLVLLYHPLGAQVFEALTYLGFQYLQIDNPGQPIGADQVEAIASHTAMPDVPSGTFATGDRMLNAVWKLNARSSFYCTQEHFIDTPTREKGQFVWDSANESEVIMGTYGDQNLSWQGLRDVARGQARYWPDGQTNECYPNGNGAHSYPTFTERYPEWLWRYYVATGDVDTAVQLYPSMQMVADFLWSGRVAATGLLTGFGDQSD